IIDLLGIEHLRNRLITELSSGELQRVSLASALAFLPPILVLDEPIARIDPKAEVEFANLLRKIADRGHIVLAFEHRLDYLLDKADRLIVLDKGKVICDGNPEKHIHILKEIDPPEISLLNVENKKTSFLSIDKAVKAFLVTLEKLKKIRISKDEIHDTIEKEESIKFSNVSFGYNRKSERILEDISFSISQGQIVGLMGINGSGKSTLFKLLSGIISPTEGTILLSDKKVKSAKQVSNNLIYLPENAKLFLVGPTPIKDLDRVWNDVAKVTNFYKELNLQSLANKKLYHLSEGERRLIAIVNSFQVESKILLLDEPTIALDKKGRDLLASFLQQAKADGKVVFIASNDPRIYHLFDRIIVLKDKKVHIDNTPRRVLYSLEKQTELLPNQTVRLIQILENENKIKLPHFISAEEFNSYIGGKK
ncbi:MAG: ATP-binding cassette domain-containing protein, partial [Candidatus Heimdallarchaeaceae archaeon]